MRLRNVAKRVIKKRTPMEVQEKGLQTSRVRRKAKVKVRKAKVLKVKGRANYFLRLRGVIEGRRARPSTTPRKHRRRADALTAGQHLIGKTHVHVPDPKHQTPCPRSPIKIRMHAITSTQKQNFPRGWQVGFRL